jgi:hypothetical protein
MPYVIRKLPNKDLYKVYNKITKEVHSKGSTLENAKKQVKLLHMKTGEGIIDKTTTGVMRVNINDAAKKFLDEKVLPLISNTTIRLNDSRKNSGKGRTQVFGYGNLRAKGFGEYANNTEYPELYRALLLFGKKIVPNYIPFTAIQVNHNYKTKKHIDGNNVGLSLAVSFGDFTGGELVIGDKEYQTKLYPIIFNGALSEHFNKPIKGNRYSLVFFVSTPKKFTEEEIFKLHNDIINKAKAKKGEGLIGGSIETDNFETDGIVGLPEFKSIQLELPTYMYKVLPDIKGNPPPYRYKLVVPINKTRNISTRKKETAISISQKPISKPLVDIKNSDIQPKLEDFSPADRLKIQKYYYDVKKYEGKENIPNDKIEVKTRGLPCYLYKNCKGNKTGVNIKKPKEPKKRNTITLAPDEELVIPPLEQDFQFGSDEPFESISNFGGSKKSSASSKKSTASKSSKKSTATKSSTKSSKSSLTSFNPSEFDSDLMSLLEEINS